MSAREVGEWVAFDRVKRELEEQARLGAQAESGLAARKARLRSRH